VGLRKAKVLGKIHESGGQTWEEAFSLWGKGGNKENTYSGGRVQEAPRRKEGVFPSNFGAALFRYSCFEGVSHWGMSQSNRQGNKASLHQEEERKINVTREDSKLGDRDKAETGKKSDHLDKAHSRSRPRDNQAEKPGGTPNRLLPPRGKLVRCSRISKSGRVVDHHTTWGSTKEQRKTYGKKSGRSSSYLRPPEAPVEGSILRERGWKKMTEWAECTTKKKVRAGHLRKSKKVRRGGTDARG